MTTSEAEDLREWARAWRSPQDELLGGEAARIVAAVKRGTRLQALVTAAEGAIAAAGLAALGWLGWTAPHPSDRPLAFLLGALVFALVAHRGWRLRGTWRPARAGVRGFAELEIGRRRRRLEAIRVAWVGLAGYVLVYVPWILARVPDAGGRGRGLGLLAVLLAANGMALVVLRRRMGKELARWERLAEQWDE